MQLRAHVTLGGHLVPRGRCRRLDRLQGVILLRQLRAELGKAAEQTRARRFVAPFVFVAPAETAEAAETRLEGAVS